MARHFANFPTASVLVDAGEGHLLLLAELRVLGEEFHALKIFFIDLLPDAIV